MSGLRMICKRCGGIKINGVEWVWDYNKDMPVRVDEMQTRTREIKKAKKASANSPGDAMQESLKF